MNYTFPVIKCLQDVLPAIEGRDEFIVSDRGDEYKVVNYAVAFDDTFPPVVTEHDAIRRECRGLIFDTKTGVILRRPFHKFFNIFERDETSLQNLDFSQPHSVTTKLDGSFISPFEVGAGSGIYRFGTKMGITNVAMEAEVFVAEHPEYMNFSIWCIKNGLTPTFEYTAPTNQIVIKYDQPMMTLLAVRDMINGEYLRLFDEKTTLLQEKINEFKIPTVEVHSPVTDPEIFLNYVKQLKGAEGFVISWPNGHRVKCKAEEYVLLHKTKDNLSREKNVIELLVNDKGDDIKAFMLEDDRKKFDKFEHDFWTGVKDTAVKLEYVFAPAKVQFHDKKSFAVDFVQKLEDQHIQKFMYAMWDGKKAFNLLRDHIAKSTGTQSKVDESRWIFNCTWNYGQGDE